MTTPSSASLLSQPVGTALVVLDAVPGRRATRHGLVRLTLVQARHVLSSLARPGHRRSIIDPPGLSRHYYALWTGSEWLTESPPNAGPHDISLTGGATKEGAIFNYREGTPGHTSRFVGAYARLRELGGVDYDYLIDIMEREAEGLPRAVFRDAFRHAFDADPRVFESEGGCYRWVGGPDPRDNS